MKPARHLRIFGVAASILVLLVLLGFAWGWQQVKRSVPELHGTRSLSGLSTAAQVHRDELGSVTVVAANAADAARSLGYAHAQDRFFQMDITRRRAAGELAALVGPAAIGLDRASRVHRFRASAETVLQREPEHRRALLTAYADGVNAGLASLGARPWEYLALRAHPEPWTPTDSLLVLYAMTLDLQDSVGAYEQTLTVVRDQLGEGAVAFFSPAIGPADAALDGSTAPLPPPPSPRAINLREAAAAEPVAHRAPASSPAFLREERTAVGSNALALAGTRTASGAALLASDPHLDLRTPNTWYRTRLEYTSASGTAVKATGVSLPGMPAIVIGTNGRIAWSFTNSYVDTGDLLVLDLNQVAPDIYYHRGRDLLEFEQRRDTIVVKGEEPVTVKSTWTIWGPIVNRTDRGKQLVHHWTMHDPAAANLELLELAEAGTVEEGLAIAHRCGIPPQNIVLADHTGAIAWTIAGRLPRRFGYDGRFPVSWTYGDRGWDGYLSPAETPVWRGGDLGGAIWSANQRHVGGELYSRLGDNAYYEGDRAAQIQANLARLGTTEATKAQPADLLAIQLDTRGRWLDRWRHLVLAALDEAAVAGHDARAEFRRLVAEDGDLRAEPGSVNYRLVRQWHDELLDLTLAPIFARCVAADPHFDFRLLRTEEAVWALHEMQPMHLLAAQHASWRELRLAAVDAVIHNLRERNVALSEATWGARNRAKIRHPFSSLLPIGLGSMLDLPDDPLPGDQHLPRVQRPSFGASLRFVVAPGRESEGIMHLPGGQSGHPLSPYYRAGHRAWVEGRPLPLLPGEPVHTLEFQP